TVHRCVILPAVTLPSHPEPLPLFEGDPTSSDERERVVGEPRRSTAQARRMTSAGLADIAEREAKAVAALDRALEARLGELDRAFATRRTEVDGRLAESESALSEAIEAGVSQFKRAASDERRLLQEEAAALLHNFERASRDHLRRLTDATSEALASLDGIV